MKAVIWVVLLVVYFFLFAIIEHVVGRGALCGVLTAVVGYGLWRFGKFWIGRLRG